MVSGRLTTYIFCLVLWSWWFIATPTIARSPDSTVVDPDYLLQSNAWLSSGNILGLQHLPVPDFSSVHFYATRHKGKFIDFYESDNSLLLGATVTSYRRLTPSTVVRGEISYRNFLGQNMGGSAFLTPKINPFDINEFADTTAGAKRLEQYNVSGGISTQATQRLRLGGEVKYETGNFTKLKDMRHTNKLLQLDLSLSAAWQLNKRFTAGIGYRYNRRIESLSFRIYGNTDRQYLSLINFGGFLGMIELYDSDSGYMADTNPLFDQSHGGSATLNWKVKEHIRWFSEFTYQQRSGYFGKLGSSQIMHTEHQGDHLSYHGVITIQQPYTVHHLDLTVSGQILDNFQKVYRRETDVGGIRTIVYYGQNKVLDRSELQSAFQYTLHSDTEGIAPNWTFLFSGNFRHRTQTTTLYPYFRKQTINYYDASLGVHRNILSSRNLYSLSLKGRWGGGGGDQADDGTYVPPSSNQTVPASKDTYLFREFEYLTTPRISGTLSVGYTRLLEKGNSASVRLSLAETRAFNTLYLGKNSSLLSLSLGYRF